MSLNLILGTATSGLQAAQLGLRAVSDNIANVNTPGYVRKTVDQRPLVVAGTGMGVEVTGTKRVVDQYLDIASQTAAGESSRWGVFSQYMDTAQGLFGDPSSTSFFFNRTNQVYAAFQAAANDPSSTLLRSQSLSSVQDFLNDTQRISGQLNSLSQTMDTRLSADVSQANGLLAQIDKLNSDITRAKLVDQDASGAENVQAQLVDQLSALMGVKVALRPGGGVDVRTVDGVKLAGDGSAKLVYNAANGSPAFVSVSPSDGIGPDTPISLDGGEVRGLLDLRNTQLPSMTDQLGEFAQRAIEQLNAAHNNSTAMPPPASLTGRNTGLDMSAAATGFTGVSTVALVDSSGVIQRQVTIDFDAMTMSVNGGGSASFSAGSFDADLTTALGGLGTATFANNTLSISGSTGLGVSIDEGTSDKAGRGFSHYFGLNDLVRSASMGTYETGLTTADPSGFTPGDTVTFRMSQPDGKPLRDVTVTMPPAPATMADLINSLNGSSTGVGLFGQFSLDTRGALSFQPSQGSGTTLSVLQDNTTRGTNGPSLSELFGLGAGERSTRVNQFKVDPAIAGDPSRLAFAKLDLNVLAGKPSLRSGDARGALALASSGEVDTRFGAAGNLSAVKMTVSRYASEFSGSIGRAAADAQGAKESSDAVKTEADSRRQATESVNLDEELVNLTTYQQAFNASARMIQATKDLFDVLSNLI
jgi:flagellar hook-associated protein 1 FlgK